MCRSIFIYVWSGIVCFGEAAPSCHFDVLKRMVVHPERQYDVELEDLVLSAHAPIYNLSPVTSCFHIWKMEIITCPV
jgi:hypothetical protein